jgi:membrane-associated phospholipid phosphatase
VALGFAQLSRRTSAGLVAFTFVAVSFPRIYLGGHYPIDVLASAILAVVATVLVRFWCSRPGISRLLEWVALRGRVTEILFFLWLFELGEGFRAGLSIVLTLLRATRSLTT